MKRNCMTQKELADRWTISHRTLERWRWAGEGPAYMKLGGRVVPEPILRDVQVFMLFYLLIFAIGTTVVVALGADLITGITARTCRPPRYGARTRGPGTPARGRGARTRASRRTRR